MNEAWLWIGAEVWFKHYRPAWQPISEEPLGGFPVMVVGLDVIDGILHARCDNGTGKTHWVPVSMLEPLEVK